MGRTGRGVVGGVVAGVLLLTSLVTGVVAGATSLAGSGAFDVSPLSDPVAVDAEVLDVDEDDYGMWLDVRYTTTDGEVVVTGLFWDDYDVPDVGDQVALAYEREDPEQALAARDVPGLSQDESAAAAEDDGTGATGRTAAVLGIVAAVTVVLAILAVVGTIVWVSKAPRRARPAASDGWGVPVGSSWPSLGPAGPPVVGPGPAVDPAGRAGGAAGAVPAADPYRAWTSPS